MPEVGLFHEVLAFGRFDIGGIGCAGNAFFLCERPTGHVWNITMSGLHTYSPSDMSAYRPRLDSDSKCPLPNVAYGGWTSSSGTAACLNSRHVTINQIRFV